jgi:hypothetical protein
MIETPIPYYPLIASVLVGTIEKSGGSATKSMMRASRAGHLTDF